jgi:glycosylphosphatidylinositol transamidase (GPIT) subunit GPI8
MATGRVFILESPNPLDLLENRGERLALEQVCKLAGYDAWTFLLRNAQELKQTFSYISSIKGDKDDKTPLFIHVSVHGNDSGIGVGPDMITWDNLAKTVQQMYARLRYYHGPIILILSACGANKQKLTAELTEGVNSAHEPFIPPEYIFVFSDDTVLWTDAVVTWTIFYREVSYLDFIDKTVVQDLLNRLHKSGFGNLKYCRLDNGSKEYKHFVPKDK